MPSVTLKDRALITVTGPDAEHLLQNIITTDLDSLGPDEVRASALLTPQGKILFDFLVSRIGADGFRLDVRSDAADDFVRRLMLYRLRAKAEIAKQDQPVVTVVWENKSGGSGFEWTASGIDSTRLKDSRFKDIAVARVYGGSAKDGNAGLWTALRIANGIAESEADYALSDAFPHDVLLDQNSGVGFRKGCYVGQEVVSRMQHRGTARRRVLIASATSPLSAGAELMAGGKPIGVLGSVAGTQGLANARIDKVKQATDAGQPIMAGDVEVTLAIPGWAAFTFPAEAGAEDA